MSFVGYEIVFIFSLEDTPWIALSLIRVWLIVEHPIVFHVISQSSFTLPPKIEF